jgi:dihydroorotate dehydrogenase electron transfer subunit
LSVYHIANNQLRTTPIGNVKKESSTVKTFTFEDKLCSKAEPGQFLMLWVPGVDEIPLSILNAEDSAISVAVKKVGEATRALHEMKAGEIIGVRGPFGNSFTAKNGRILMVGGGTGIAPLMFLARKTISPKKLTFVIGAKTWEELLFFDDFKKLCGNDNVVAATEDGSCGFAGLCTEPLQQLMAREKFDFVYTCGPELMVRRVFDLAEKHGLKLEASLERLMRCAIGLCGSCVVGGYRVCRDGPVFTSAGLRRVKKEFGVSKRDFDGRKIGLG